jgi:hypothetical protein
MMEKIFVDVDLEKRSIWSYVEDGEHSRAKTLYRFSIAFTGQQLVGGKEGVNRTLIRRTSADHRG